MTDTIRAIAERAKRQAADVSGPSDRIVWVETEGGESLVYDRDAGTDEWVRSDYTITDPDAGGVEA